LFQAITPFISSKKEKAPGCEPISLRLPKGKMMSKFPFPRILIILIVLLVGLFSGGLFGAESQDDHDATRAKLLSYLLRQQLSTSHYSQKPVDDAFSKAAFGLYLKQLDGQKRFLLQEDIRQLQPFANRIDDELVQGRIQLPLQATRLLNTRVVQVQAMVDELLAKDFDLYGDETIEIDPEKIDYSADSKELRERWRKILKLQVLSRYLDMEEEQSKKDPALAAKPEEPLTQAAARERVRKSYDTFFDRLLEDAQKELYNRYFEAVSRAFDPHTNYLAPAEKEDFDISMSGSLEGIGATLREEDGFIKVVTVVPGSAAWRQGQLEAEDIILKVGEGPAEPVDITDTRIRDAVSLIRGRKGSEVRLTVRKPDGTSLIIPIIRDVVQIEDTFVKSTVIPALEGDKNFGYVKIPSFYRDFKDERRGGSGRNVTDDLRKEIESLKAKEVDGIVIDLRNNGGGALTDAVSIVGLFIKTGPVVQVRSGNGKVQVLADDSREIVYDGPLTILVNEFSASASEILAGALQDYGRAVIIGGEHTHGKGTVQAILDLDRSVPFAGMERYQPLGALKVTIQKFYRISGESTQARGVVPDIVLPDRLAHLKTGERHNEFSLPWDTITPTKYSRWKANFDLELLQEKSRQRVATDPLFDKIREDVERARIRTENTRQTLNIDEYRKQRLEAKMLEEEGGGAPHAFGRGSSSRNPNMSAEERQQEWIEQIQKDAYAREAMAVLGDILSTSRHTASATKK
jgi:carboxyl-terminal processing protease